MDLLPTDEQLALAKNKIFVISLPRTGTKSLSKMLMLLGYRIAHCPSIHLGTHIEKDTSDIFADTPVYCPSVIARLRETDPSNKFIYIDRHIDTWLDSFQRTLLNRSYVDYMTTQRTLGKVSLLDKWAMGDVFGHYTSWDAERAKESFMTHQRQILATLPPERLLVYSFEQGWNPLCQFLGKDVPDAPLPHINRNTLFEKIA